MNSVRVLLLLILVARSIRPRSYAEAVTSGPSCSKLTMSLVNDSLKFTSSDMQIC